MISIDMDPLTPGIQNTLAALPGANITVDVVLTPGAVGVSSYGVSTRIDNTELTHVGNVEALPAGFMFNLTLGSGGFVPNVAPGVDQVSTFEAVTLGLGPVGGNLVIGTISFTVVNPVNDGLTDVTPGFFVGGVDGMFNNAGVPIAPVINPGFLVPEPRTTATVLGIAALLTGIALHRARGRTT